MSETFAVSENQRAETSLTEYTYELATGGGKPGQGYGAVLTSSTVDGPARETVWPASGAVYPMNAAVSGMRSDASCPNCGHDGSSVRMFPDSLASVLALPVSSPSTDTNSTTPSSLSGSKKPQTLGSALSEQERGLADALSAEQGYSYVEAIRVAILATSSLTWSTSGTASPGALSMRAGSECPSVVVACSLSAVLETRPVPPKYWLSAKAAAGILRRAEARGKELPPKLQIALESLVRSRRATATTETSTKTPTSS